jgi:hypothetical protein
MPPRIASLTDLLNSLDAATYFFVSSGMVIAVAALLFFALGLWLGQILWKRYKRLFRQTEEVIESYKGEVAQLKRRLAEQSTRPLPGSGPSPLQSIAFRAAAPRPSPPAGDMAPVLEFPLLPEMPLLPANLVEAGKELGETEEVRQESSVVHGTGARSRLTLGTRRAAVPGFAPKGTSPNLRRPGIELLFRLSEVLMVPRSRAFCIWTERHWVPPVIRSAPLLPGCGFTLWSEPDFKPACTGPRWFSRSHTLWTSPGWTSSQKPGPPTRSARAFTVWTEEGWRSAWYPQSSRAFTIWTEEAWSPTPVVPQPLHPAESFTVWTEAGWQRMLILPWSQAFTVWTDSDWVPSPIKAVPWPASEAGSLWTSSEFEPACRGALLPSRAFTKWTEKDWSPPHMRRHALPAGRPFTLWTDAPSEKQGFVARTLAAAKQALGLGDPHSSVATRASDAPAATADESRASAERPPVAGAFPPSRAFTLWGETHDSEEAKATVGAGEPNGRHLSLISPLDLKPLGVPGEGSPA